MSSKPRPANQPSNTNNNNRLPPVANTPQLTRNPGYIRRNNQPNANGGSKKKKDKRLGKYKHKNHTHKTKKTLSKCKK